MNAAARVISAVTWLAVGLFQLVMTQLVTFLVSLLFPGMENFPEQQPVLFAGLVGLTFSAGVFAAGWLAMRLRWVPVQPRYKAQLAGALLGAYLPLAAGLLISGMFEAGSPFFLASVLACILGFWIPALFPGITGGSNHR